MIDSRAIVDPSARIGANVRIGPFSIVGADVEIGDDCIVESHVVLKGPARIGRGTHIYQFSTVGEDTPAIAYQGETTWLEIGENNVIREGVTIHRGMAQHAGVTRIGSNNLLMAYVHIGHDCIVGDHCVMANNAGLAGHVEVGDWVVLSGYAGVPQFRRIGAHAFVGGMSLVTKDVPAYVSVNGNPAVATGMNVIGLQRRGFSDATITKLREAYRVLYRKGHTVAEALEAMAPLGVEEPAVGLLIDSVRASEQGIIRERRNGRPGAG